MPIPYLIIFEGRNGSSHLVSLLNAHPGSLCYPEIMPGLDAAVQESAIAEVARGADIRPINPYAADDNFFPHGFQSKWNDAPFASVGFKTKVTDLKNIVGVLDALETAQYRLIYLRRANPLKAVLSWINGQRLAQKTQNWNARSPAEVQGPVAVDMQDFKRGLRHRQVIESLHKWFYDTYGGRKINIFYEDMLTNQSALLSRVFGFLGSATVQSAFVGCFVKNTPDSLRKAVVNYDDLVREYRNTEFACYLD